MSDLNKIDGVYEVPLPEGTFYLASRVTNRVKSKFQSWLSGRVRRRVFDARKQGVLDPAEFKESLDNLDAGDAAGRFDWGSVCWAETIQGTLGIVEALSLLAEDCKRNGAKVSRQRVCELMVDDATAEMMATAWGKILDASPNFRMPVLEETG